MPEILPIPAYVFKNPGDHFLLALHPDGRVSIDGGHSAPNGVAEARELFESITVIKPAPGTRYLMLKVDEVPTFKGRVNRGAIDTLNAVHRLESIGDDALGGSWLESEPAE